MRLANALLCGVVLLTYTAATAAQSKPLDLTRRWVYAPCNFQVDKRVDELIALAERSKRASYNGLVITDYKWGRFADRPARYYRNLKRTRDAAARLGIELVPCVMPVGYSGSILMNNPNLAEGIAVRDCEFRVAGGRATVADSANLLPFGTFETVGPQGFAGWDWMDGFGTALSSDAKTPHNGRAAARMTDFRKGNSHGNCRLVKTLTLKPWHQYHLSLWIRTDNVDAAGDIRVTVLTEKGRSLNYTHLGVKPTQPWTEHHVILNPMEHTTVRLYIGIWGGRKGTIWIDDVALRQTAGINLLRREGCPLKVTNADGSVEYTEGKDFRLWQFDKMGRDPWAGNYKVLHPAPPIVLTPGSHIADGQRLKVSYYHTLVVHDSQVCCCLSHPELFRHLEQQVRDVKKHLGPRTYFMSHDEIRVAGQCQLCRSKGRTPGEVLAENVRRCTAIIRKVDPQAEIVVWSDMFDPHHNARDNYYLVGGTLKGSWEGLDPQVRIANWNAGHREASLGFFAKRGHKQIIAAYYDSASWQKNLKSWLSAARKAGNVDGIIYTTWQNDYRHLEAFAKALPAK